MTARRIADIRSLIAAREPGGNAATGLSAND